MSTEVPIGRTQVLQSGIQLVLILTAVFLFVHAVGLENIQQYVENAGMWGPFILILLKASTLIFAPLGGSPLYPIAGILYGFGEGFFYMFIGDTLGSVVTFYLSRFFGRPIIKYLVGSGISVIESILDYLSTTKGLVQARLFFTAFQEGVSYAAGLTQISFWRFIFIHMGIGLVPIALLVVFGSILVERSDITLALLVSAGASVLALIGAVWFYRIARKKNDV